MGGAPSTSSIPASQTSLPVSRLVTDIVALLFIASLAALAIYQLRPTAASLETPVPEFSAGRAMVHIKAIAGSPRALGTAQHSVVRDYILNELRTAGLSPEVQRTTAINPNASGGLRAATIENVVARLKGTNNRRAILLMAHYDSVPTGPGASDDGSGVAVLLETLRALKAGPPLANDIILLFTDGEEDGLFGAHAFVTEHPWARELPLVLNFEARGASGPSILFETSDQNGGLIREFARAAPHPVANSFAYEIYRLLPNNTDLTVIKNAGLPGLNFAYLDESTRYHTQLDSVAGINENSLQHHGDYALALARHFGSLNDLNTKTGNAVYFDVLGLFLVYYSRVFLLLLTAVIAVLALILVGLGLKKGRLTPIGLAAGLGLQLASLIVVPIGSIVVWLVVQGMLNVFGRSPQAAAYHNKSYFIGFIMFGVAVSFFAHAALLSRIRVENLMAGSLLLWVFLLLLASVLLPGVTYLLAWPVLFCLPGLANLLLPAQQKINRAIPILFFVLAVGGGLLILAPAIYLICIGLNLNAIGIIMAIVMLVSALLTPHLLSLRLGNYRALAIVVAVFGILLIGFAAFKSTHDAQHPKLDSIFYGLNADTGKAIWASLDGRPDEWTSRVLTTNAQRRAAPEFFAPGRAAMLWQADAPPLPLAAPEVVLVADRPKDASRTVTLRISSPRGAPVISIYLDSALPEAVWVNGKPIEEDRPATRKSGTWKMNYYNPAPDGIELTLEISSADSLKVRVVDQTYGLPEIPGGTLGSRPSEIIPAPVIFSDSTIVSRTFSY